MIEKYIVEQARNTDIIAFFERRYGFGFVRRGGDYRCQQHKSLAVKDDRRSWYWHSKGVGGYGALDYLTKVENMSFRESVELLTGYVPATAVSTKPEQPKTLILPEKSGVPVRIYDYLCVKRGIDGDIVNTLIQRKMLYEDRRGNVVFVGFDENGTARFASLRGTYGDSFRGDCAGSDKRYGFRIDGNSERLYVFESPIDAMSHASLVNAFAGDAAAWKKDSRLSLSGTSETALFFFLNKQKEAKELVFCLDNDRPGRESAEVMARKYAEKGYRTRLLLPVGKDFNEDLVNLREQARTRRKGLTL